MAFFHDPRTRNALRSLERGDTSGLAQLFEDGHLNNLHRLLANREDLRQKIAKALRQGAVRGAGRRPTDKGDKSLRDLHLTSCVAYWMGYGAPGWQDEAEPGSYHHLATEDIKASGYFLAPSSVRRIFGQRKQDAINVLGMTDSFLHGVESKLTETEDTEAVIKKAYSRLKQVRLEDYACLKLEELRANYSN